jgi:hypothetical protein
VSCTDCGDEAEDREEGYPLCGRCLSRQRFDYLRLIDDIAADVTRYYTHQDGI